MQQFCFRKWLQYKLYAYCQILSHITLYVSICVYSLSNKYCLNQQFCITASKYGGLYRTFYGICSTQYFVENPRPTSVKMKIIYILRCKLWTQSKHVKIYDNLRISPNQALFSIKPGARPIFFKPIRSISLAFL